MKQKIQRMKNGQQNFNTVKKGYKGHYGYKYHATKGWRKVKDFIPNPKKILS